MSSGDTGRPPPSREQCDLFLRIFDDSRSLIAALKVQRWDVVKWAVTINIGLAAASVGFKRSGYAFFFCAMIVALFGILLVYYYNRRLTRTRARLPQIHRWWRENLIDLKEAAGLDFGQVKGTDYDLEEMKLFTFIIGASIFPALFVWALGG